MRIFLIFSTFVASQKISFQLEGIDGELIAGERGEISGESTELKSEIDDRLWTANPEALYTIKISEKVYASVLLKNLQMNGFNDEIVVYRNNDGLIYLIIGIVYHIDYSVVPTSPKDSRPKHFTTTIKTNPSIEAVRPLLKKAVVLQPGAEKIETKSFLQQYWMYLVPVALFLLLAPPEEPPQKKSKKD